MFNRFKRSEKVARQFGKLRTTEDSHKVVDSYTHNTIFTGTYDDCCKFQRAFGSCQVVTN